MHFKRIDSFDGVTFYPEVRYRGVPVRPDRWHAESPEPMLLCVLNDLNPMIDMAGGPTMAQIIAANTSTDRSVWERLLQERTERGQGILRQLHADGWQGSWGEGLYKYLHVDEIEKIEGPPPVGAF
jgi:hypothetical protein